MNKSVQEGRGMMHKKLPVREERHDGSLHEPEPMFDQEETRDEVRTPICDGVEKDIDVK